jgi:putative ABC transport system substrate-binding protein
MKDVMIDMTVTFWELCEKRLELLKETVPTVLRVAFLGNPSNPVFQFAWRETEIAARDLGVELRLVEASDAAELEAAVSALVADGVEALVVQSDPLFFTHRELITEAARKGRLPAMYPLRDYVEAGGLMAYGPSAADLSRRAAACVQGVFAGMSVSDLPMEPPMRSEFVINLTVARALELMIPRSVLLLADRVID